MPRITRKPYKLYYVSHEAQDTKRIVAFKFKETRDAFIARMKSLGYSCRNLTSADARVLSIELGQPTVQEAHWMAHAFYGEQLST